MISASDIGGSAGSPSSRSSRTRGSGNALCFDDAAELGKHNPLEVFEIVADDGFPRCDRNLFASPDRQHAAADGTKALRSHAPGAN